MNIVQTLLKLALVGGEWVLYLLLLSSVLSLAVMIQKAILFYRSRIDWDEFSDMLSSFLNRADTIAALEYAKRFPNPAARTIVAGLGNLDKGAAAVEEVLIGKRISEKFRMENRLMILGTLGNNAPFIGLFGTVLGIIKAFHDLSMSQNPNPSVVMSGVS
ncbi:MAG TPA: MotA/TolQ/ExbB proton channel family protein, partial [Acidobacteriota bacterium]|nr:MotA/TolQ/ExbB proton channel family protein [Acidobacteriota bacterium]